MKQVTYFLMWSLVWIAVVGLILFLCFTKAFGGTLRFEWEEGAPTSVYTLRLTRINLSTYTPGVAKSYTSVGVSAIDIKDICQVFYPTDTNSYGLICKVGGYKKVNNTWIWMGWSKPVVLDILGDMGELCESPNPGTQLYNLPYPLHSAQ